MQLAQCIVVIRLTIVVITRWSCVVIIEYAVYRCVICEKWHSYNNLYFFANAFKYLHYVTINYV